MSHVYSFDFKYAGYTIDAAQDGEGGVWISTATIETVLGLRSDSTREALASKSFKAFTGEEFQLGKLKSKSTKSNSTVVYYSEATFLKLIYYFTSADFLFASGKSVDNTSSRSIFNTCHALVSAGFLTDFHSSIQSALGIQLTETQREYLRALVHDRIQAFRAWTDIIRDRYIQFYGCKPEGWYYGQLVGMANGCLFGVRDFGSDRTANMTEEQQLLIRDFERFLVRRAKMSPDLEPKALLIDALKKFM